MREGTNLRVMAADRPYGEFYDFYSIGPEYFGYYHVYILHKYLFALKKSQLFHEEECDISYLSSILVSLHVCPKHYYLQNILLPVN
jgi:hypothetical protein